jgi:hypothetical protein
MSQKVNCSIIDELKELSTIIPEFRYIPTLSQGGKANRLCKVYEELVRRPAGSFLSLRMEKHD